MLKLKIAAWYLTGLLTPKKSRIYRIYFVYSSAVVAGKVLPIISRDDRYATSRYEAYKEFTDIYPTFLIHSIKRVK